MTDRAKKISEFPNLSSPNGNTKFVVNHTSNSGVTNTYTLSVTTLLSENNSANVILKNSTPANSTVTVKAGTIFYDSSYLYIAVANNTLKRVALSSF